MADYGKEGGNMGKRGKIILNQSRYTGKIRCERLNAKENDEERRVKSKYKILTKLGKRTRRGPKNLDGTQYGHATQTTASRSL